MGASLALIVFGILRGGAWGFVRPRPNAPVWVGLSPTVWLVLGGGFVLWLFMGWENRLIARGDEPLVDPAMLDNPVLRGGLTAFFFQYLLQAGLFFAIPLYLSVALGLSAIETGVRIMPLSITLLLAAVGIPKLWPLASPRRVVQIGIFCLFLSVVIMTLALDGGAGPEIVTGPMLLAGLGIGALASQLGAITVSSVSDERTGEVGGLQNTVTNLGASIGTALIGAVLIAGLTSSFFTGIAENPDVPPAAVEQASVSLASGIPFVSDADLSSALADAGVAEPLASSIVDENSTARLDGLRAALAVVAGLALLGLFFTRKLPNEQQASSERATAVQPQ